MQFSETLVRFSIKAFFLTACLTKSIGFYGARTGEAGEKEKCLREELEYSKKKTDVCFSPF